MDHLLRNALSFIVGLVVGSLVNMAFVWAGPHVIPPPAGVNMTDAAGLAAAMPLLEPRHFLFPFLAHALGTFAGALTAYAMSVRYRVALAYGIAGLTLLGGIAASFLITAPAWFITVDLVFAYLPMAWLATQVGRRWTKQPAASASAA